MVQASRWLNDDVVPRQAGNDHPTIVPMGTYRTSYGHVNSVIIYERPDDPDFDPYQAYRAGLDLAEER